jgi:hypothetical protein
MTVEQMRNLAISINDDRLNGIESKAVKYRVEFLYSYGWDDAHWTSGDGPWLFDSHADAWAEIDDFCSVPEFDKPYIKSDFRVIKVTK